MLGMVGYVIYLNTDIWKAFDRQNSASEVIRNYSEYAAYDETEIRGQDAVSLITKTKGDPFVLVQIGGTWKAVSCNDYNRELDLGSLDGISSFNPPNKLKDLSPTVINFNYDDETSVQQAFLTTPLSGDNSKYACYQAHLVYDGAPSTTVVGIVLTR